jgi:hypothetical protein
LEDAGALFAAETVVETSPVEGDPSDEPVVSPDATDEVPPADV